ncbi:1-acyl-sn-glycerol-3-phosphate acyltransferase [Candidatus Bipolaricaulota bacterium]|nr:1-acyl-sn-glycerol-3-phosphate acyltransferase [Candidatus Bipolaricaulota bacterium]
MLGRLRIGIKNGLYTVIAILCLVALKILFRIRIRGRENIDKRGEYIAVARHRSYWDIPVFTVAFGISNRVHFISRKGLMHGNPLVQPLIRMFSTIIDRENFNRSDFRRMLAAMKRERLIGLFPEGTTQGQVDAKAGVIHFAKLTGKRILPVNIIATGSYPPNHPFRFPRLTVSIGESFVVSDLQVDENDESTRAEQYQQMSEQLMLRVDYA